MKAAERIAHVAGSLAPMIGKIDELCVRQESSRPIQLILKHGSAEQRDVVFNELKGNFRNFAIDKIAHHVILKLSLYGTPAYRACVVGELRGHIRKISLNPYGAQVIDHIYMSASKTDQYSILRELIDTEYAVYSRSIAQSSLQQTIDQVKENLGHNKGIVPIINIEDDVNNLVKNLLDNAGPRKSFILDSIEAYINNAIKKEQLMFRYIHSILKQYFDYVSVESSACRDIISSIAQYIPALHHTLDGVHAAMHCVAYGTVKDRKNIIRSIKGRAVELSLNANSYLLMLRILDVVDDSNFVKKNIIMEFTKEAPYGTAPFVVQLAASTTGSKVLLFLFNAKSSKFLNPRELQLLEAPMAPAYLYAKAEVEDEDDSAAPKKDDKPLVDPEELVGLNPTERDELIAKAESAAAAIRMAKREAEELALKNVDRTTLTCTYKKDNEAKYKGLAPAILPQLLKSFLLSQVEATGQKGKESGATSNIALDAKSPEMKDDVEGVEGAEEMGEEMMGEEDFEEDFEEDEEAQASGDELVELTQPVIAKPFGYLESVLRNPTSGQVFYSTVVASIEFTQAQNVLVSGGGAPNLKKHQSLHFNDVFETIEQVFVGLSTILSEGEKEEEILFCELSAHNVLKRLALSITSHAPTFASFVKNVWEAINSKLDVILQSNRARFVLLALLGTKSDLTEQIKSTIKKALPKSIPAKSNTSYTLLHNLVFDIKEKAKEVKPAAKVEVVSEKKDKKDKKAVEVEVKKTEVKKSASKKSKGSKQ